MYDFFFSYTRSNNDAYLKRLFEDLSIEIRLKRGLPKTAVVGFFDQGDIELGQDWDDAIVQALQSSRVMLAVASPGYFNSEYCGKEWEMFHRRCAAAAVHGKVPPLLKSLVWIPYAIDKLPPKVAASQLLLGDPHAVHNGKGCRHLLLQINLHRPAYRALVDQLADEIVAAADRHPIAPLQDVPTLAETTSAFRPPPVPLAATTSLARAFGSGPKHVHFIFVAASPQSFGAARPDEAYLDSGAGDWRPYFPADRRPVNPLLAQVAARNDLLFSSTEIPFGGDLIARIDAAWQQRQIVVIVVDPWSVDWDAQQSPSRYQSLLRELDGRLDYHWCVLVPANENDPAFVTRRTDITETVQSTFDRHARLSPNLLFYRDGIGSADALQSTVAEVLTRLKEEIAKRAPVLRPVPGGLARPIVTGPSAQG